MMLRITYDEIVKRVKEERGLPEDEIKARVDAKLKQLSGLISREGAAHIIANELGLKLFPDISQKRFKVRELVEGLRVNELVGRVVRKYDVRDFKTENREGRVASFLVADETGSVRIVLWDLEHIKKFEGFSEGDVVKVVGGMVRENQGFREVHLGSRNELIVNPPGEEVSVNIQLTKPSLVRKQIKDLAAGNFVSVLGTVVQVFEPRFYDACPECNRKVVMDGDKFRCDQHGHVPVKLAPIVNMLFDDGTDNVRVVFFRDLASKFFGLDVATLRDNAIGFEERKKELLGRSFVVSGRVVKNDMFDRFELMASNVEEVDAREIASALLSTLS